MPTLLELIEMTNNNILPQDWTAKPINHVFEFIGTSSFSRNDINYELDDESIYYIHYGDIHATYKNAVLDFDTETRIPVLKKEIKSNSNYLKEGDLIIADASEDYEGIGEALEVYNIENKKVLAGLHTFALRDKNNETAHGYRAYLFKNPDVKKRLKTIATGSKVYGISKGNLEKFKIILPPLPEQQKIAKILGTWDKAINLQKQLIDNKKYHRKTVMKKLLSGEKRFNRFSDEWKFKTLGKIALKIGDGLHGTPKYTEESDFYFINGNNLKNNVIEIDKSTKCVTYEEYKKYKKNLSSDCLLLSINGTIGNISFYNNEKIVLGKSVAYINCDRETINYLFYYLQSFKVKTFFKNELTGSTIKNLSLKTIRETPIFFPSQVERQEIAYFLLKFDKEISILEKELISFQNQKQGLMQQLLTGKVRVKN